MVDSCLAMRNRLGALGASFWVWTQRKNHSTDISRLQTGRTDEIDRLQRIHSDELSRLETEHARVISLLQTTTETRLRVGSFRRSDWAGCTIVTIERPSSDRLSAGPYI